MIDFEFHKTFQAQGQPVELALKGTVHDRSITAVLGKSGSGKTSLALMMAGLLKADRGWFSVSGHIFEDTLAGRGVFTVPEHRGLGFVFQNHRLFPSRTVRENILFSVHHGSRTPKVDFDCVVTLLKLERLLDRLPATLSGGQAQRVSLGRALLSAQNLLIMDEPTASLDPSLRSELTDYIAQIPDLLHLPVLYITHHIEEACKLADQALLIENGRVIANGTPQAIARNTVFNSDR